MINKFGIMVDVDVNANNWLTKVNVMMDLFGILIYRNVNVLNNLILENIQLKQIAIVEENSLIISARKRRWDFK